MLKFIKESKKGMTVIEVLVAMAVFGVISVPLMGIFLDSMVATKLAQDRIETNALVSVVKEEVTKNIKQNIEIKDMSNNLIKLNDVSGPSIKTGSATDLKIIDLKNNENIKYKFDAYRTEDYGDVSCGGIMYPDSCEYLITIRNIYNNIAIQRFTILVNKMN